MICANQSPPSLPPSLWYPEEKESNAAGDEAEVRGTSSSLIPPGSPLPWEGTLMPAPCAGSGIRWLGSNPASVTSKEANLGNWVFSLCLRL